MTTSRSAVLLAVMIYDPPGAQQYPHTSGDLGEGARGELSPPAPI